VVSQSILFFVWGSIAMALTGTINKASFIEEVPLGPRNIEEILDSAGREKNMFPDFLSPGFQVSETVLTLFDELSAK
jgi:hypothetical protein